MTLNKLHTSIICNRIKHLAALYDLNDHADFIFTPDGLRVELVEENEVLIATVFIKKGLFETYEIERTIPPEATDTADGVEVALLRCTVVFASFKSLTEKGGVLHMDWSSKSTPGALNMCTVHNDGNAVFKEKSSAVVNRDMGTLTAQVREKQWDATVTIPFSPFCTFMTNIETMQQNALMDIVVMPDSAQVVYHPDNTSSHEMNLNSPSSVQWIGSPQTSPKLVMPAWVWMVLYNKFMRADCTSYWKCRQFTAKTMQMYICTQSNDVPLRMQIVWECLIKDKEHLSIVCDFYITPSAPAKSSKKRQPNRVKKGITK